MMTFEEVKNAIENASQKRKFTLEECEKLSATSVILQSEVDDLLKARWCISEVAKQTQRDFKDYIEPVVTMALRSVYEEEDYTFRMDFEIVRNKPECKLVVVEKGIDYHPGDEEVGGGVVDTLSFALRIVLWSLANPKSRPIFFLDEPMKNVGMGKEELLGRAMEMMKEISKQLGVQLIIISHEEQIAEIADKAWSFSKKGDVTQVEVIK